MKKILPLIALASLFYIGCKKDGSNHKREAEIKTMIQGDWYYQSYSTEVFVGKSPLSHDAKTTRDLYAASHYHFYDDNTCDYGSKKYNYTIKSNSEGDSLVIDVNYTTKFKITYVSDSRLSVHSEYPNHDTYQSQDSGAYVIADHTEMDLVFGRTQIPKP
ncbi:hypothetical protein HQ865_06180 [Mucilaginibacter mali]|uniref:Lipocalin-like domain-containing protein n=1 Tax=Mucilaginibacter mali TaxID=2740462 RepID=A0A7D4UL64_9SPHI|nr:hypothetical protein [Mucilaginibacter mali]QKJ29361.1 hypothetical protein HQ865_06180 [Mucilaginibacter mali]